MPTEALTANIANATTWTGSGPWENTAAGSFDADYLEFTVPALTTGRRPLSVQVQATVDRISTANAVIEAGLRLNSARVDDQRQFPMAITTTQDAAQSRQWNTQPHVVADPNAVPQTIVTWQRSSVANMTVRLWVTSGTVQLSDVVVLVGYSSDPTVSIDAVHNVDTRNPDIEATFTDPDNALAQPVSTAVIVVVDGETDSSGVAAGAAGFDPLRATPVVPQSGAVGGFPPTIGPLDTGITFWVYVRAAKRIGFESIWSAWVGQSFTTTAAALPAPTVTATAEPSAGRVRVEVDADPANLFTYPQSTAANLNKFIGENVDAFYLYTGGGSLSVLRDPQSLVVEQDDSGLPWAVRTVEAVPVEVGGTYTADAHALRYRAPAAPATDIATQIALEFVAETGTRTEIARSAFATDYTVVSSVASTPLETDTEADRHLISGVAPAGATHARIRVWSPNAPAGAFFIIDELAIYRGSAPAAWSPGEAPSPQALPASTVTVERSDDGVSGWAPIDQYKVTETDDLAIVYDRTPAGDAGAYYRAFIERHNAVSTYSAAAGPAGVAGDGWWLHSLADDTASIELHPVTHPTEQVQDIVVLEPVGGKGSVLAGPARGERGTVTAVVESIADKETLTGLFDSQSDLVLATHLGESWKMRLSANPTWTHIRVASDGSRKAGERWRCRFAWREVD